MILDAFFSPVPKSLLTPYKKLKGFIGSEIQTNNGRFPDPGQTDVALIGLGDNADICRKELYALQYQLSGIKVSDFGNLRSDGSEKNLLAGLSECLIEMREQNIIPLLIGEDRNYSAAIFKSNPFAQVDMAVVSPYLAFQDDDLAALLQSKNKLFHASFIGLQSFLNPLELKQKSSDVFSEHLRLGDLRAQVASVEPLLRQADYFEFDMRSIKHSDFSAATTPLPSGLHNQEACAVCRYAGISNSISFYLFNHFKLNEAHPTDAQQVAQMLWYVLDGIDNRFNDMPALNNRNFTVYKCHAHSGEDLLFLNSEQSGRWWMQIPQAKQKKKTAPRFLGCTAADHEAAEAGEVPEKYYRALLGG